MLGTLAGFSFAEACSCAPAACNESQIKYAASTRYARLVRGAIAILRSADLQIPGNALAFLDFENICRALVLPDHFFNLTIVRIPRDSHDPIAPWRQPAELVSAFRREFSEAHISPAFPLHRNQDHESQSRKQRPSVIRDLSGNLSA